MVFQLSPNTWTSSNKVHLCVEEPNNETITPTRRESGLDYSTSTAAVKSRNTNDMHVIMMFHVGTFCSLD